MDTVTEGKTTKSYPLIKINTGSGKFVMGYSSVQVPVNNLFENIKRVGGNGAVFEIETGAYEISLNGVRFSSCTVSGDYCGGGAISCKINGGKGLTITNGVFEGCTTAKGHGGAILVTTGTGAGGVTLSDVTFSNCKAQNGNGGALYISNGGNATPVSLTDVDFVSCSTTGDKTKQEGESKEYIQGCGGSIYITSTTACVGLTAQYVTFTTPSSTSRGTFMCVFATALTSINDNSKWNNLLFDKVPSTGEFILTQGGSGDNADVDMSTYV